MIKAVLLGVANLNKQSFEKILTDATHWQLTFLDKDEKVIQTLKNVSNIAADSKNQSNQRVNNTYEAYTMQIEPQDCHAIVYADILLLCIRKDDFSESMVYLKKTLSMRAKTNPTQKLRIACLDTQITSMDIKEALLKNMNEALTSWFRQEVIFDDCLLSNEE